MSISNPEETILEFVIEVVSKWHSFNDSQLEAFRDCGHLLQHLGVIVGTKVNTNVEDLNFNLKLNDGDYFDNGFAKISNATDGFSSLYGDIKQHPVLKDIYLSLPEIKQIIVVNVMAMNGFVVKNTIDAINKGLGPVVLNGLLNQIKAVYPLVKTNPTKNYKSTHSLYLLA